MAGSSRPLNPPPQVDRATAVKLKAPDDCIVFYLSPSFGLERREVLAEAIRQRVELLAPRVMPVRLELLPPMEAPVLPHRAVPVGVRAVQEVGEDGGHRRRRGEDHVDDDIELQKERCCIIRIQKHSEK
ncbi:Os03g0694600 [Oryza sativa Japonica Group]|uniref:Os03g0694600 protein n=2 Tax=Oryza sativa subsp. japonica TaxID=39947 RepID=Q0DPF4_ORYSJ|nr:Os03g0694600 [Oryza sativa Japonica Group]BAS85869.1 Os03g0694600 [Oryza sativa Japonica Group]|eukprot:NP_001050970.1 Os03g0694600 [Oryza sativa Japonica Group]